VTGRRTSFNQTVKRWPGWLLLAVVAAVLLALGVSRGNGVSDPGERADALARQVACPVCDGESVFESRNRASINLRNQITSLVNEGRLDDDEILAEIQSAFPNDILLVPPSDGVNVLVWALPVAAVVGAAIGVVIAFRRWRERAVVGEPSDDDREIVAAALASGDPDGP
jgi:cytochrome c-type biogenesis protein CcmH